jgi:hypothetical protein
MQGFPVLVISILLTISCGQAPSFVDNKDVNKSADANPNTKNQGIDTNDTGSSGGTSDGKATDDKATGDDEAPVESTGSDDDSDNSNSPDDSGGPGGEGGEGGGDNNDDQNPDGPDSGGSVIHKTKTYPAELFDNGQVTATLADPYLTQEITLKRTYTDTSSTFNQVVRPTVVDTYVQGNSGIPASESFNQSASKPLDILVVIDNSGSMQEEQINLSQRLLPLLSYVNESDWRIGVVTTDPAGGCLRRLIKKGDADASTVFSQAVTAGTSGDGNERGVLQAVNALKCVQNPWIRAVSSLAILFVSDEDNCSDGSGCGNAAFARKEYLEDYLNQIRVPGVNAKVYGLFWHPSQSPSACSTAMNKANIYASLVADTAGTWGSICDADYSTTLSVMSQNISTILDRRFTLQHAPEAGSEQVFINDVLTHSGYSISGNVLVFDLPPADGDVVKITYSHGSAPIKKTFDLSSSPLDQNIAVEFDNTAVLPSLYSYSAANNNIVFFDAPPERTLITVRYTKDLELKHRFDLGRPYVKSSLRAYINNIETLDYEADPAVDNVVTLQTTPAEGSVILFTYTSVGDPVLRYPFTINGRTVQNLSLFDAVTGVNVPFLYLLGLINISSTEFSEGRQLLARYWNEGRDRTEVNLPALPLTGSVEVSGGGVTCDPSKVVVTANLVVINKCNFADTVTDVTVVYKYIIEHYTSFLFDDPELSGITTPLSWKVWVNNVATTDFTVRGLTVTLPAPLPVDSGNEVKVEVSYKP